MRRWSSYFQRRSVFSVASLFAFLIKQSTSG